jgi:FkbM family methyltransferase
MDMGSLRKEAVRQLRYHAITEHLRYRLRKGPRLHLAAVDLELHAGPGDVMLDCGANVGDVSSQLARSGATVYAFEPNPRCFEVLQRRFARLPHVHCLHCGVLDRECTLSLSTPRAHAGFDALDTTVASSLHGERLHSADYELDQVQVPCIDIDAFVRGLGRPVLLMKVDIEGAEIEVLNRLIDTGAIDLIEHVVVETHEAQMPDLAAPTQALREHVAQRGLAGKVCFDWY